MQFADRASAGRALGQELAARGAAADIVLGLTRGGVPVALEVARALGAELDIIVVKKIGAPFSPELAIGAVCADGSVVTRSEAVEELGVPREYVQREIAALSLESREAEVRYRGGDQPLGLAGKRVVIVDDGVATGATMEAAIKSARGRGALSVIVAVPVASAYAVRTLEGVADGFVALDVPPDFYAVGQYYDDFSPVANEEVRACLEGARRPRSGKLDGRYEF
jgi:predicted phosphoribosyltransferase